MKMLATTVSLGALALASCATQPAAMTQSSSMAPAMAPPPATAAVAAEDFPQTVEGARSFVAAAEKDLFDLSTIASRAEWVNATYLNDDTDAIAAHFGTIRTEKGVTYALAAARYANIPGLDFDTARKLNLLRGALTLAAPQTPGAAAELNTIATRLSSTYGKGRATLKGKSITGDDVEAEMGTNRNPAELAEM